MTKSKWLAAVLNLILPGLGFFYARKRKLAFLTLLLGTLAMLCMRILAVSFPIFAIGLSALVVVLIYGVIGGYMAVEKGEEYPADPFDKPFVYGLSLVAYFGIVMLFVFLWAPIGLARVPTPSMNPALQIGDYIAFRKTKSIDRSDVVTFWWPDDVKTMYIKRCIGIAGDSVAIKSGQVFVNGVPREEGPLKLEYTVVTSVGTINPKVLQKIGLSEDDFREYAPDRFGFYLTKDEAASLKTMPWVKEMTLHVVDDEQAIDWPSYHGAAIMNWSADFYGPLYLPKKGDKIELTAKNIALYSRCIQLENEYVGAGDSTITINGKQETIYEFKDDYYFMMGDNRHNTLDSRYWGLLPGRLVVGKAMYVYWGKNTRRIGAKL